jgi:hypothetical protein
LSSTPFVLPVAGDVQICRAFNGSTAADNPDRAFEKAADVPQSEGSSLLLAEIITVTGRVVYENIVSTESEPSMPDSPHSYSNNYDNSWYLKGSPSASQVQVFFSRVDVEYSYDHVKVWDRYNNLVWDSDNIGGHGTNICVAVPGNQARVQLTSDFSITDWGFQVTKFVPNGDRYRGVPMSTIEIWDDDYLGDDLLWTGVSDNSGYFSVTLSNHDGGGANGQDIYVKAFTTSDHARVIVLNGGTYGLETGVYQDVPDESTLNVGNMAAPDAANSAWIVYSNLVYCWNTLMNGGPGYSVTQVKAAWNLGHSSDYGWGCCQGPNGPSHYGTIAEEIHLRSDDGQDTDTILHECGHHVMFHVYSHWLPHTSSYSHYYGSNSPEDIAWQEGWPNFFSIVVALWTETGDRYFDLGGGVGSYSSAAEGVFYDMETSQKLQGGVVNSYPGDTDPFWAGGDTDEATVSYALYDIYDYPNDGLDTYYGGFLRIWWVMAYERHSSLSEFYDSWRAYYKNYLLDQWGCDAAIKQGSLGTINYDPVMFYDDFLDGNTDGWILEESGGDVSLDYSAGLAPVPVPAMKIDKTSVNNEASARHQFPTQGGDFIIEAKIRSANTAGWFYFLGMLGNEFGIYFCMRGGSFAYYTTTWNTFGMSYSANTWYQVDFKVHAASGTYDILINGVLKVTGAAFNGAAGQRYLNTVKFQAGTSTMGSVTGWVDEVAIRGGSSLFSDQFIENLVGWTQVETGGPVDWDGTTGSWNSPSMKLYKQTDTDDTQAFHTVSTTTTGKVFLEARAKISTIDSGKWCYVNLYNSAGVLETYLVLKDGYICYWTSSGWASTTFSYGANTWFKLGLDVDLETGLYDIYGNGVRIAAGTPLWGSGGSHNIAKVGFQAGTHDDLYGMTLWGDDILVSWR